MPDPAGRRQVADGAPAGRLAVRPPEAVQFEKEFPGASWLSARVIRELEVVGGSAEALRGCDGRRHGLSHIALNVLAVIEGNGGPMAAGAMGERVHITSGSMTSVLDTLERNGYVVRLADPEDRRRVLVEVTPAAQELLDQALPEVVHARDRRFAGIQRRRARGDASDAGPAGRGDRRRAGRHGPTPAPQDATESSADPRDDLTAPTE